MSFWRRSSICCCGGYTLEQLVSETYTDASSSSGDKDQLPIQSIQHHHGMSCVELLSLVMRSSATVTTFKAHLKAELFSSAYNTFLLLPAPPIWTDSRPMASPINIFTFEICCRAASASGSLATRDAI